tara:strand:- start:17733 stop:19577 length:1845 start_codon:yes stop_codon:yes gene_type:complete
MIELDSGVVLPLPNARPKGFKRPKDINQRRWDSGKDGRWKRAYLHCLYSLPLYFDLPLHSLVPRMAKKMLEATSPFNVALRFMGEMELQGYVKFERGMDERVVVPTQKFLSLVLDCERAPDSAITFPKLSREEIPRAPIRNGVSSEANILVTAITSDMASQEFKVNHFMYDVIKAFPPVFDKTSSAFMYKRCLVSAEVMLNSKFMFPYFLDSRSRMYTDTTCGFSPQGADYEKAIIIPTYVEPLSDDGYLALVEAAKGYSEKDWCVLAMIEHGADPYHFQSWREADKPYSYLSCARLLYLYHINKDQPLPAFIPLDGRCSGLQHWSALVRSNAITRHLGMHIDEHELDIYEKVAFDWSLSLGTEEKVFATRKAAKIPVMTWGYNATMMTSMDHMGKLFGAKTSWDDSKGEYVMRGDGLERAHTSRLGVALYKNMQDTLGPLQGAVNWVSNAAKTISSAGNAEIQWPTPDGFTGQQRKIKGKPLDIDCKLSNESRFQLDILDFSEELPNSQKHKSAIAPNIIHSLDATHLRMVARKLKSLDLPMIFIHDSFATHCNHRKVLYDIIIETFIELYSRDYLSELKTYWEKAYKVSLPDSPKMGSWDPKSLIGLNRFFL